MTRLDLREVLADIDQHLTEIRRELLPAINAMAGKATTGYPTASSAGHTSGGDTPDLTGKATAGTAPHPDRHHLDVAILTAERHLRAARGLVHKHTPPGEADPGSPDDPGCASCARLGEYAARYRGDLCVWCYRYRTCHKPGQHVDMPDRDLLAVFHDRGKVTPDDFRRLDLPPPGATPAKEDARL